MTEKESENLTGCFLWLLLLVPHMALDAWTTKTIWGWFVPGIFGFRAITMWEALALGLVVTCFKSVRPPLGKQDREEFSWTTAILARPAYNVLVLLFALIVRWGMTS